METVLHQAMGVLFQVGSKQSSQFPTQDDRSLFLRNRKTSHDLLERKLKMLLLTIVLFEKILKKIKIKNSILLTFSDNCVCSSDAVTGQGIWNEEDSLIREGGIHYSVSKSPT
jgi:Sec7-like guanine-nucleotide exchange factor